MSRSVDARPDTERGPRPRRGLIGVLSVTTAVAGTGLAAGGTAGALVAVDLTGNAATAGLPVALHVIGSAAGAILVSWQAARGRRGRGLALGFAVGASGAAVVVAATAVESFAGLLVGSAALGAANSSIFLTRYAAAGAVGPGTRGRALGTVFLAMAVGAVISPTLLGPSGLVAQAVGLPPLTGLYLVAVVAFGVSAALFVAASNPAVPLLGRCAAVLATGCPESRAPSWSALLDGRVRTALVVLAGTNLVMVGVMTIAPVHLTMRGSSLEVVGGIVALHVLAMFAPAPLSGRLADRIGPDRVALMGAVVTVGSAVLGLAADHSTAVMAIHLLMLGVGWNLGIVGGSAMLADAAPDGMRAHTEGVGEATMGLGAMAAAPVAGAVAQSSGYPLLSIYAAVLVAAALPVVVVMSRRGGRALSPR